MTVWLAIGGSSAPNTPSPAAPSPFDPLSSMFVLEKPGAPSTRQRKVTVTPAVDSLMMRALTLTFSDERGMTGRCCAPTMSGAMFVLRRELTAPGVPSAGELAPQFCPCSFGRVALINSSEPPSPSCAAYHVQPR